MTTLHGSTSSPWRHAEGYVPPEGMIASARDPLTHSFYFLEPPQPYRYEYQFGYTWVNQQIPPQDNVQYNPVVSPPPPLSQLVPHSAPYVLHSQTDVTPPPTVAPIPASEDTHARMDKLEQRMKQMRVSDGAIGWDDFDGALVASLPT
ncbi:hypothetical protein CK203_038360 [Vitis vinifera]|nr:hypothetical protein CK203_038360 [Vitis vinifera]